MNQNLKKGDVITVEKEIKSKVKNNEDVSLIVVGSENEDSMSNVLELLDSSIFQIVENDMHPEIGNFGVDIKKYSIKATNVESVAKVPENKDMIRINGEVDIDTTGKGHKTL